MSTSAVSQTATRTPVATIVLENVDPDLLADLAEGHT